MFTNLSDIPTSILKSLSQGTAIPAHPLALDENRQLDERRQRALTRYYLDAGAGGLAVGVHTTQYAIRSHGLYEPVLAMAAQTARAWSKEPVVLVAGIGGVLKQAIQEAEIAKRCGYHFGMVNVAAYQTESEEIILDHCRHISEIMPIIGFYLLPECGGRLLSVDFWKKFCGIKNVAAIKLAPFNRYHTMDAIKGLVSAEAENRITLYTGNDDHIVLDLLAPFIASREGERVSIQIKGGLLGHWSVWTKPAVELLKRIHQERDKPTAELLALDSIITDCNSAVYDGWNNLKGCIPGCLEVLRRQGLVEYAHCLDPKEIMSPGQKEEIDRIYREYPEWTDDKFVTENLERWLAN